MKQSTIFLKLGALCDTLNASTLTAIRNSMANRIAYVLLTSAQVGAFTESEAPDGPVYTREFLKGTLQLMGCKPRFAEKISDYAFKKIEALLFGDGKRKKRLLWRMHPRGGGSFWVSIPRKDFNRFMMQCLESVYVRSTTVTDDWQIATRYPTQIPKITLFAVCAKIGNV